MKPLTLAAVATITSTPAAAWTPEGTRYVTTVGYGCMLTGFERMLS